MAPAHRSDEGLRQRGREEGAQLDPGHCQPQSQATLLIKPAGDHLRVRHRRGSAARDPYDQVDSVEMPETGREKIERYHAQTKDQYREYNHSTCAQAIHQAPDERPYPGHRQDREGKRERDLSPAPAKLLAERLKEHTESCNDDRAVA